MISAYARAFAVLGEEKYLKLALDALAFIQLNLWQDGVLLRSYRGGASSIKAFADDYTFLITALLDVYEVSGDVSFLKWAFELQGILDNQFWDDNNGGYFQTSSLDHGILFRMKEEYDGAEPSPVCFPLSRALLSHI